MKRDSIAKLMLGLGTGVAFGFLLQKGEVNKHRKIVGQLRLKDWDVVKVMATAAVVGGVGTHLLQRSGHVEPSIKPLKLASVTTGGLLFGTGMAVLGYCPGTSVAAVGEGRRDAAAGVAGMFVGALAYVWLRPRMKPFLDWGDQGAKTVPELAKQLTAQRRTPSQRERTAVSPSKQVPAEL